MLSDENFINFQNLVWKDGCPFPISKISGGMAGKNNMSSSAVEKSFFTIQK